MGRIKGVDVVLISKEENGKDPFNKPIYKDVEVTVENVIVAPAAAEEVVEQLNLTGRRLEYILGIPKGDTHTWENQEVRFFGKRFRTFGAVEEGLEALIPLKWHKKVRVERYE